MFDTLKYAVGKGKKNDLQDVAVIQDLLNRVPKHRGGAGIKLKVDGKLGATTTQSILDFQKVNLKTSKELGIVESNQNTFIKLRQLAVPIRSLNDGISYL